MFAAKNELLTRPSGYNISRSLRFRSSASAYLSRTPASAGNRQTWTWSGWVKRGKIGVGQALFSAAGAGYSTGYMMLQFTSSDYLNIDVSTTSTSTDRSQRYTNAVYRDPSAFYHVVLAYDVTQATDSNRLKLYVNGVQQTLGQVLGQSWPSQNTNGPVNSTVNHGVGYRSTDNDQYLDGYLAEVNFIDGQALTPSSFGAFDINGVWQPAKYTGSYGTNGFYLPFSDNSALTTASNAGIGKDFSGNSNYWATNNISITSGVTYDSMIDSPTNYADGGNGRGNYAVLNPVGSSASSMLTISDGNLTVTAPGSASNFGKAGSSLAVSSGKWYFEVTIGALDTNNWQISVAGTPPIQDTSNQNGLLTGEVCYNPKNSSNVEMIYNNGTITYTNTVAASVNQVIGVAFDADNRTVQFYRQNTAVSTAQTINSASVYYISLIARNTGTASIHYANFGQRPFTYTPPSGFSALNTQNLP